MVLTLSVVTDARADSASDHVRQFQDGLIQVMKRAESLGVQGRYKELQPLIEQTFHLPLMAALSAGKHWNGSTNEQRRRLVKQFSRMSTATLATLFAKHSGEKFEIIGEEPGPQGTTLVRTVLEVPGRDDPVNFSYVARMTPGQWRLIDVILDGQISELKVRISEYRLTLKKGGIEALIQLLKGKADELLS